MTPASPRASPGWKIDIPSDAEFVAAEADVAFGGGGGGIGAVRRCRPSSDRQACPNASRPAPRFCGRTAAAHHSL